MINPKYFTPLALALALALACMNAEAREGSKLKKWVDENGMTHYGDVIPPKYANTKKTEIREGGIEVQEKEKPKPKEMGKKNDQPAELTREQIEQQRHDRALLATYTSEQEIDAARDRNLQQVNALLNTYNTQRKSIQIDLDRLGKEKEASEKAGKPVDPRVQNDINLLSGRMNDLRSSEAKAQEKADAIKAAFEADKLRFRELTKPKPKE